jgi:uncharacterized protein (DUF58 family)
MSVRRYLTASPSNPLIQALTVAVAIAFVAFAFMMGAVMVVVLLGVGAVAVLAIAVRLWWARLKSRRATRDPSTPRVIEGDYTVVGERSPEVDRPTDRARSPRRDTTS